MLNAAGRTHAGRIRTQNEDTFVCRGEQGLFAVVDGMGGEAAGEVAAAIAAGAIGEVPDRRRLPGETLLSGALRTARDRVIAEQDRNPACASMGAVATAMRFEDNGRAVCIAHVGDTRAWLVNGRGVRQLTQDHVADAPEPGHQKAAVARDLGRRDLTGDWVQTARVPVAPGDLLILASDGLHDAVGVDELNGELMRLHAQKAEADAVAARLVAVALARGGPDNVTVVAVRVSRFRRGGSRLRRLDWAGTLVVLGTLVALAFLVASWGRTRDGTTIPTTVTHTTELSRSPAYTLEGSTTKVAPGATLTLRGVEVAGAGWGIEVGTGGHLVVVRSTLTLAGPLEITLATGASLEIVDSRISADRLAISGLTGSSVKLRHAAIPMLYSTTDGLDVTEEDVRLYDPAPPPGIPAGATAIPVNGAPAVNGAVPVNGAASVNGALPPDAVPLAPPAAPAPAKAAPAKAAPAKAPTKKAPAKTPAPAHK